MIIKICRTRAQISVVFNMEFLLLVPAPIPTPKNKEKKKSQKETMRKALKRMKQQFLFFF